MRVLVVGRGRVGTALARALRARAAPGDVVRTLPGRPTGPRRQAVADRALGRELARADVVVLAAPDPALPELAARCARVLRARSSRVAPRSRARPAPPVVLHCAGRLDPRPLSPLRALGAATGVLHPLVSFAIRGAPPPLEGSTFVVAGDPAAARAAARVARRCGARPLVAPLHGPAYHAGAALVAGSAAAAGVAVARLFAGLGASEPAARAAVAGLLRSVASNVERLGGARVLTGPFARGDAAAVAEHRAALARLRGRGIARDARQVLALYEAVGPSVLDLARAAGLPRAACDAVERALKSPAGPAARARPVSAPPRGTPAPPPRRGRRA
jgi:predicted short-subunit dehydrogenase-like oxidoreductase (DUF2520 family)